MANVIIINGAPGSGKTTLLRKLANDLDIGYITKDQFKELLGDSLGIPDSYDVNAAYGRSASEALFSLISALDFTKLSYIVESAFWADIANERFAKITDNFDSYLQIYVTCEESIKIQRINGRIANGERHAVHWDGTYSTLGEEEIKQRYRPLELPGLKTIYFDTTNHSDKDYRKLVQDIQEWGNDSETTN